MVTTDPRHLLLAEQPDLRPVWLKNQRTRGVYAQYMSIVRLVFKGLLHHFSRSETNDHFRPFLGTFAANSGDYLTKKHVKMGKMSVAAVA